MVDIVVGVIPPIQNNPNQRGNQRRPPPQKKKPPKDKRTNQADRRESVREGVVVTLSYKTDRRKPSDRRKRGSDDFHQIYGKNL